MPRLILGGSHTWYMVARRQVVEGESGEQCRLEPQVPTWGMVLEFVVKASTGHPSTPKGGSPEYHAEFRVQSLFELTNSKPTKLALKAVPSEQRTYAAMEHHMHTIRLQRTYTHSRTRGRHSALRASLAPREAGPPGGLRLGRVARPTVGLGRNPEGEESKWTDSWRALLQASQALPPDRSSRCLASRSFSSARRASSRSTLERRSAASSRSCQSPPPRTAVSSTYGS